MNKMNKNKLKDDVKKLESIYTEKSSELLKYVESFLDGAFMPFYESSLRLGQDRFKEIYNEIEVLECSEQELEALIEIFEQQITITKLSTSDLSSAGKIDFAVNHIVSLPETMINYLRLAQ